MIYNGNKLANITDTLVAAVAVETFLLISLQASSAGMPPKNRCCRQNFSYARMAVSRLFCLARFVRFLANSFEPFEYCQTRVRFIELFWLRDWDRELNAIKFTMDLDLKEKKSSTLSRQDCAWCLELRFY